MNPLETGGVVDKSLAVYGTTHLKIAGRFISKGLSDLDMSVCQEVSGNTYSTAIIIGEKAAVIIAAELGIQGV
jgi:alcohol oxidase